MHKPSRKHAGFSLVELMVALVAGLLVSGAAVAFLLSSMKSNGEYVVSTRLTQELRNTLELVTRDLRRAGYNNNALDYLRPGHVNPFSSVFVKDASPTGAGNEDLDGCIIYAYDSAFNGTNGIGVLNLAGGEVRGIRRVVATMPDGSTVGVLEYAQSAGTARPACGTEATPTYTNFPPDCHSLWCPLSDPSKINITQFKVLDSTFTLGTNPEAIKVRDLDILLQGQLVGSTEFTRGIRGGIRIRTDCFKPTTADCNVSP
jgi:prepilin-type N-terminal cleavage/methylation domain-containing protein